MGPLESLVDYLNPVSENFFLKLAFIPSEGFLQAQVTELKIVLESKFPLINQVRDTINAVTNNSYGSSTWGGITADFSHYGAGTVTVVSPEFVNFVAPKIKFWMAGFIIFITLLATWRRASQILGR